MKALVVMMSLISAPAFADGFYCENLEANIRVKAYNQVAPEHGTRNSAVMVLSNPAVSGGRKTIATFEEADGLLTNSGSHYIGHVDMRFNNSARGGELLAGTKLGEVKDVVLDVEFSYAQPVDDEAELAGVLTLEKRNGDVITVDLLCERYLKH